MNSENIKYFDSFGVEHVRKKIKKFIGNKNIITKIYRTETHDSIMCGYFILDLLILCSNLKVLLECATSFSPNDYEKNDKTISKYIVIKLKCIVIFAISIENLSLN